MNTQRIRPAAVIAVISRKGGVGKTTIMHHILTGMALSGFDALAIEADDNPRLRAILAGLQEDDEQELGELETAYGLFTHPDYGVTRCTYAIDLARLWENTPHVSLDTMERVRRDRGWAHVGRCDYIPGSENIRNVETLFERLTGAPSGISDRDKDQYAGLLAVLRQQGPDMALAAALQAARNSYDVIVVDTPPSLSTITRNIIAAATHIIIPVDFDFASPEDYRRTTKALARVRQALASRGQRVPAAPLVVYNKFDARNPDHLDLRRAYTERHQEQNEHGQTYQHEPLIAHQALATIGRDDALVNRAAMRHRSLHQYAPLDETVGQPMYELLRNLQRALGVSA